MRYSNLSITFVLLLFSCDRSYNVETKGLNNLLQDFNTSISNQNHLYILIPTFSCLACVQQALNNLSDLLVEKDKPKVTIIYQKIDINLKPFFKKAFVYPDVNNSIDKLPFSIANLTFIKTYKEKIYEIQFVNVENVDQIINRNIINEIRE